MHETPASVQQRCSSSSTAAKIQLQYSGETPASVQRRCYSSIQYRGRRDSSFSAATMLQLQYSGATPAPVQRRGYSSSTAARLQLHYSNDAPAQYSNDVPAPVQRVFISSSIFGGPIILRRAKAGGLQSPCPPSRAPMAVCP